MSILCLSGHRQAPAARLHRRLAERTVFVEVADRQIAVGLDLPPAFQPAIAIDPMTSQRPGWNPSLALRAAKTRKVVIGMGIDEAGPAQRNAPRLQRSDSSKAEACKPEICKAGFCESFEHRSPPFPRLARQAGERDSQLGATITLTRRKPARLILIFCGITSPTPVGPALPKVVLPMCCFESARR
jgi:hypothetical protein